jgi:LEA14-like dessication related protein
MKRISAALLILSVFLVLPGFLKLPKVPKKLRPTAKIEKFGIHAMSLRDVTFFIDVSIKNPYPLPLKLSHIGLQFDVEENRFFTTRTDRGFSISPRDSKTNRFLVQIRYSDVMKVVKNYSDRDYLSTRTHVTIAIPLPDIQGLPPDVTFKFSLDQKIPALDPDVRIADFRVQQPSTADIQRALSDAGKNTSPGKVQQQLSDLFAGKPANEVIDLQDLDLKITVDFTILLANRSETPLSFDSLDYMFHVNGAPLVEGKTDRVREENGRYELPVHNTFSTRSMADSIIQAFRRGEGTFSLKGHTFLRLPPSVTAEPVRLNFDEKGTFDL